MADPIGPIEDDDHRTTNTGLGATPPRRPALPRGPTELLASRWSGVLARVGANLPPGICLLLLGGLLIDHGDLRGLGRRNACGRNGCLAAGDGSARDRATDASHPEGQARDRHRGKTGDGHTARPEPPRPARLSCIGWGTQRRGEPRRHEALR